MAGHGMHVQLNLIDGTSVATATPSGPGRTPPDPRVGHPGLRAFRIDPNLAWGNQLITNDVQGGYYRADYQSRRWTAGFGIDEMSQSRATARTRPSSTPMPATS